MARRTTLVIALLTAAICLCSAFITPLHKSRPSVAPYTKGYNSRDVSVSMGFFDFLKKNKDNDDGDKEVAEGSNTNVSSSNEETSTTPFFAAKSSEEEVAAKSIEEKPVENNVVAAKEEKKEVLSPKSQAEQLRAQAARIRLEADKRQVELTLEKIAKLTNKLEVMKTKDTVDTKDQQSVEEELVRLKSQLFEDENGEMKPVAVPVAAKAESAASGSTTTSQSDNKIIDTPTRPTLSKEDLEQRVKRFEEAPEFMKVLVAKTVGFGVDEDNPRLNATDIVLKLHADEIDFESINTKSKDFADESEEEKARRIVEKAYKISKSAGDDDEIPKFTAEQIKAKEKELEEDIPDFFKGLIKKYASRSYNSTELAIMMLEEEFKESKKMGGFMKGLSGSRLFNVDGNGTSLLEPLSDVDFMMQSLYPASTRKEDATPDKRQVNAFLNDVVATTKAFTPSSEAIPVAGGWIIRGTNNCKSGDELIEKLDKRIANDSRLKEKISFFLLKDPFPNSEEQMLNPLDWPQVLFVAGPDVARDSAVIVRTIISAVGIATAWYGSIYPFLANSKLLSRATEAMELSDAGMPTDLSWLSDMSIPLFLSFMGLQVIHEIAHLVVAKSRNFEVAIPTLVPSIMTGITNSITSLKSSPKNKQDLVDFAVAGPLAGMIGSIILLCYGLALTSVADPATVSTYPGLPLAILRQSSLGGGLIDIFLGNGVLNVPSSAEGAQALASTLIALHPFAVAGFFSLVVNALSLVPAGRTDGGRISMALFGRSGCQAVSFASLAFLFILGITQSDLLLFYFAFIVFFQSELEIPVRNEVDGVPLTSAVAASFAGFLMLLTLIPM